MAATVDVRYVKPVVLPRFVAPVARRLALQLCGSAGAPGLHVGGPWPRP